MRIPTISSLFKPKGRAASWFAVRLAARSVCMAEVQFVGAIPRVVRCECHDVGAVTPAALEKLFREAKVGHHDFTTLLEPGDYQMMLVDAPNVPTNELKTAIRWKIKDGLNFHIDDATVDVLQIPATKYGADRPSSLYAIVAANSVVQKRIHLFEQAGIALSVIDITEMAQRNIAALFEQADRALALLTFDDSGALLTFTSGGELYMTRRIEIGTGHLSDANENMREQYRDRVELELQRSLDYFDRQFNHLAVSRVLVCVPDSTGLVPFLAQVIERPLEKLDLSQGMDISAVPQLSDDEFVSRMLPVLGAALREERREL